MRNLILLSLIALPTTAFALEPSIEHLEPEIAVEAPAPAVQHLSKFEAYKQRMAARRAAALEARRAYNASKGPAVFRTAIYNKQRFYLPFEEFHVRQPPIPVVVRPVMPWYHSYYGVYHY